MYLGLNNLGLTGLANQFSPSNLFVNGEGGAHFETYDPQSLLRRRNQLTYSSQFSNAAWTKTAASIGASDGVGVKIVEDNTTAAHLIRQDATSSGSSAVVVYRLKAGERSWARIQLGSAGAYFNLGSGTLGTVSPGWSASITAVGNGYYDCMVSTSAANSTACLVSVTTGDTVVSYTGDGVSGIYLARAQLEWNTTTPSAYQEVTDWNTEYLAATGAENIGMWQDGNAGSPVTGVEQPIGVWIDRKQGTPPLGGNVWSNSVATGSGATISVLGDGSIDVTATSTSFPGVRTTAQYPTGSFVAGEVYRVDVQWSGNDEGRSFAFNVGGATSTISTAASGTRAFYCVATASTQGITFFLSSGAQVGDTFNVKVIGIKKVVGNHATQSGSTKRPILSARVNAYSKSEQPDDAFWTKTECAAVGTTITGSANSGVTKQFRAASPTTTGTTPYVWGARLTAGTQRYLQLLVGNDGNIYVNVDLVSGVYSIGGTRAAFASVTMTAASGGGYDVTFTYTSDSGVAQMGSVFIVDSMAATRGATTTAVNTTFQITRLDLRTSDDAAKNIPAYQRVNTASDYDTAGFPHYLKFDGIDDALVTGSIDLTSFNCASLWAGITKLTDTAAAVAIEFSASSSTTAGSFALFAPGTGGNAEYVFRGANTTAPGSSATASGYAAPVSSVVTGLSNNGSLVQIRINGTATNAAGNSVGALANAALNLGGRNNSATSPINARLYSTTVRASTTPTDESSINKMNAYDKALMKI